MRTQDAAECLWKVAAVKAETSVVTSLSLAAVGERPSFLAGQYLTVKLPGFEPREGKSYSISSGPEEPLVRLTVKAIGPFSKALAAHAVNDTIATSMPYGFFYPEDAEETKNFVFIAGGIGITPFMSMLPSLAREGKSRSVTLHYSNRTEADMAFGNELETLLSSFEGFKLFPHVTRESPSNTGARPGRMSAESILESLSHDPLEADYFICGSIDFTGSIWKGLRQAGVPSHLIYTEGFY